MSRSKNPIGKRSLSYIISFSVAYGFPIGFHLISTLLLTIKNGAWAGIIGTLLVGALIYSPYYGIYYAALTFIHAITDMMSPPRRMLKNTFLTVISALIPSAVLIAGCLTVMLSELDSQSFSAGIIIMIVGFALLPVGFLRYIFARC